MMRFLPKEQRSIGLISSALTQEVRTLVRQSKFQTVKVPFQMEQMPYKIHLRGLSF